MVLAGMIPQGPAGLYHRIGAVGDNDLLVWGLLYFVADQGPIRVGQFQAVLAHNGLYFIGRGGKGILKYLINQRFANLKFAPGIKIYFVYGAAGGEYLDHTGILWAAVKSGKWAAGPLPVWCCACHRRLLPVIHHSLEVC
jgi:hypothetical protein